MCRRSVQQVTSVVCEKSSDLKRRLCIFNYSLAGGSRSILFTVRGRGARMWIAFRGVAVKGGAYLSAQCLPRDSRLSQMYCAICVEYRGSNLPNAEQWLYAR